MLDTLKFVRGAVAKKDVVPTLTHFHIAGGQIVGGNGRITIGSPIALDLTASPRAVEFVAAIERCKEEASLSVTPAGRLAVRSGSFKAFIDCIADPLPMPTPAGQRVGIAPGFVAALQAVEAFTAEDASRRWAMGVLFKERSMFATNNIVLVEFYLGQKFPHEFNLPAATARELIRIGEDPEAMLIEHNSATFIYSGGRWLHSVLYDLTWPDVYKILERESSPQPVPAGLFDAAHSLKAFGDEKARLYLMPGFVGTRPKHDEGANVALASIEHYGVYNIDHLLLLESIATKIDLSAYPGPALFFGDNMRGAIIGMRE